MDIILIRHAQPAWAQEGVAHDNPGLTPMGHEQAAALEQACGDYRKVEAVWVSPTQRTLETAAGLPDLGVPQVVVDNFTEYVTPVWQGLPAHEVAEELAQARYRTLEAWRDGIANGGERFEDFCARVCAELDERLAALGVRKRPEGPLWDVEDRGQRALLVGHAGTNGVVLSRLLGLAHVPWPWERFAAEHAAITRVAAVEISDGYIFALKRFNQYDHLPPHKRSR